MFQVNFVGFILFLFCSPFRFLFLLTSPMLFFCSYVTLHLALYFFFYFDFAFLFYLLINSPKLHFQMFHSYIVGFMWFLFQLRLFLFSSPMFYFRMFQSVFVSFICFLIPSTSLMFLIQMFLSY